MSSDNAIWCSNCNGTDFERTNGAFYCQSCGTESREHGPDFVYEAKPIAELGELCIQGALAP